MFLYIRVLVLICVCLQMYAIDDCELVRSYMTRTQRVLQGITYISIHDFVTLLYIRMRTFVESKRPNSVHILSETLLHFCFLYLIIERPIYRAIFFFHETVIQRHWLIRISIAFIELGGSRNGSTNCAIALASASSTSNWKSCWYVIFTFY